MATTKFKAGEFEYEFEDNTGEILEAFHNAVRRWGEAVGGLAASYAQDELRTAKPTFPGVAQDAIDTSQLIQSVTYKVVE